MAEAAVSVVVEQLATLLKQQASEQIDLLTGVEDKVKHLAKTFERIQAVLSDAEERNHEEKAVRLWLEELQDISYEIDDVLDEWSYLILKKQIEATPTATSNVDDEKNQQRVCCSLMSYSCCFRFKQVILHRDIALKIKEITAKLDSVEKKKDKFRLNSNTTTASQQWRPDPTAAFVEESEIFGREDIKNDLISRLLDNNLGDHMQILCLVGTGGIGKTTLAQLVYNDDRVNGHFEKGWVCVSNPFDVTRVAKQVVETLGSSSSNLDELNSLLGKIKEYVSGKRFLIVFDDVWTEEETKWTSLKASLKNGARGSVILLTTRNEPVARAIGCTERIPLNVLSESHSWSLFYRVALSGQVDDIIHEHEREKLENVGRQIVKKCDGLPLALRIIGNFLRDKTSVEEWEKVKDSKLWNLKEENIKIFRHLYLSYNELSPLLKSCFSYCVVFPKDEVINVDDLVRLWMAQGYLDSSTTNNEIIEDYGRECFKKLAMRSFFQEFEKDEYNRRIMCCKMHDIVHDFAQHIRKRECLVIEEGKEVSPLENARHVTCLSDNEQAINSAFRRGILRQTRSVFMKRCILEEITSICSLRSLRTLKLQWCTFEELPTEIGNLIHLRYLCLGYGYVKKLPETIYELYKLQTLDLSKCDKLRELPPGIEKLKCLRHLNSREDLTLPTGTTELISLQTLNCLSVGRDHNKLDCLKNLNQLRGSIEICILGYLDDSREVHNANLKSKKYIKELKFKFSPGGRITVEAMEAMEPPPTLRELCFFRCGKSRLPVWIKSLTNLVSLRLEACRRFTSLDMVGMLPCLETLEITRFIQLKSIRPSFWGVTSSVVEATIIFPKLMKLIFWECGNLEYWEDISGSSSTMVMRMMPRLRCLVIRSCDKLKGLPYGFLRHKMSLECIEFNRMKLNPTKLLLVVEAFSSAAQPQVEDNGDHHSMPISPHQEKGRRSSILSELVHSKDYDQLCCDVVVL